MPKEEKPPEESPRKDQRKEQPAASKGANYSWQTPGKSDGGTGYWDKANGEWLGLQPAGANDPSKWEDRQGDHWTKD
eukprot:3843489-Heterocapsa_arctica.AAC.1